VLRGDVGLDDVVKVLPTMMKANIAKIMVVDFIGLTTIDHRLAAKRPAERADVVPDLLRVAIQNLPDREPRSHGHQRMRNCADSALTFFATFFLPIGILAIESLLTIVIKVIKVIICGIPVVRFHFWLHGLDQKFFGDTGSLEKTNEIHV